MEHEKFYRLWREAYWQIRLKGEFIYRHITIKISEEMVIPRMFELHVRGRIERVTWPKRFKTIQAAVLCGLNTEPDDYEPSKPAPKVEKVFETPGQFFERQDAQKIIAQKTPKTPKKTVTNVWFSEWMSSKVNGQGAVSEHTHTLTNSNSDKEES